MSTVRVIPAPDQGDAQFVVLAAELFPTVLVIVLATTIWDEVIAAGIFDPQKPGLEVEDDIGTEYRRALQDGSYHVGPGWRRSHGVNRMNPEFEPAVPREATQLRVTLGPWGSVALTI